MQYARKLIYVAGALVGVALGAWVARLLPEAEAMELKPDARATEHAEV